MEYIFLVIIGFLAGFINTLAGGGTILTLPMLIFLGLPPNIANGTNRIAVFLQNIVGAAGFRSKGIDTFPHSVYLGGSAFLGALIGAKIGVDIKGELFNKILGVVVIMVVFFVVFKPSYAKDGMERLRGKPFLYSLFAFFLIGIYGGFIQAGTGFLIMLALTQINSLSLIKTNAYKTVIVLIYSLGAVLVFAWHRQINITYGIILAVGNSIGAWIASRWSVGKDDKVIRYFLIIMAIVMAVKLWFPDLINFQNL